MAQLRGSGGQLTKSAGFMGSALIVSCGRRPDTRHNQRHAQRTQHNQTMRLGRRQWFDGDRTERARGDTDLALDGSAVAVVVLVGGEA